jgi:hypothetical protein
MYTGSLHTGNSFSVPVLSISITYISNVQNNTEK